MATIIHLFRYVDVGKGPIRQSESAGTVGKAVEQAPGIQLPLPVMSCVAGSHGIMSDVGG